MKCLDRQKRESLSVPNVRPGGRFGRSAVAAILRPKSLTFSILRCNDHSTPTFCPKFQSSIIGILESDYLFIQLRTYIFSINLKRFSKFT